MIIVLYQPKIPQNTGNIVRTCKVTGSSLILVKPGFDTSDRMLKRAGLDYWDGVNVDVVDEIMPVLERHTGPKHFFSSKAKKTHSDASYQKNSMLIFGAETTGLPEELHTDYSEDFVTLPMIDGVRCLNLATSVGIGVYEAWRQIGYKAP